RVGVLHGGLLPRSYCADAADAQSGGWCARRRGGLIYRPERPFESGRAGKVPGRGEPFWPPNIGSRNLPLTGPSPFMLSIVLAGISAVIWLYLMAGRGLFWLGRVRDDTVPAQPAAWPSVAVVIPARNEAAVIRDSVGS